jgi:hypothetical protein
LVGFPIEKQFVIPIHVNLAALARDLNKDVFVLEGGSEAPNVVLDSGELQFYGAVARKLNPKTYIYEFIKDQYDTPYASNPGTLVTSKGKIRRAAFQALQKLFVEISARKWGLSPFSYMFQVRAAGGSTRYSDWSNPVSRMCV